MEQHHEEEAQAEALEEHAEAELEETHELKDDEGLKENDGW